MFRQSCEFAPSRFVPIALLVLAAVNTVAPCPAADIVRYARFQAGDTVAWGVVEGERIRELSGDLFSNPRKTDRTWPLKDVRLLVPTRPTQVIALAGNYRSHLTEEDTVTSIVTTETRTTTNLRSGDTTTTSKTEVEERRSGEVPEQFRIPQPFFKSPSCLTAHETNIVIPKGANEVHFEAELVVVIGRRAKNVPEADALDYVFGVTCGNDVSARIWQQNDTQWWRAKGSDTFGPCGPWIVTGLNYDNLLGQLRLNGEIKQKESTKYMINNVARTVSFVSEHVTLHPGDLIFTGTSGKTSSITPGDVVEVEFEGIGVLRNVVAAE